MPLTTLRKTRIMATTNLTATRLRELLDYDSETGKFRWRLRVSQAIPAMSLAGAKTADGYVRIKIDGVSYRAHRLAWLWVYGSMPTQFIDHINGVRDDNRIVNLRDVTRSVNQCNLAIHRDASSDKLAGVKQRGSKWQARIRINGKPTHLGTFGTVQEAVAAYRLAVSKR